MIDCELILLEPCAHKSHKHDEAHGLWWSRRMIDCKLILLEPCAHKAREKRWRSWSIVNSFYLSHVHLKLMKNDEAHKPRLSKRVIDSELIILEPCARRRSTFSSRNNPTKKANDWLWSQLLERRARRADEKRWGSWKTMKNAEALDHWLIVNAFIYSHVHDGAHKQRWSKLLIDCEPISLEPSGQRQTSWNS